ncbi:hypothetical protein IFR05_012959 [Cadophora sp. M221]|nr:hypothetical protein IFR05_012959 [Cadophora sp. M221]
MKLSLSFLIVPLFASACIAGATTKCNADNCLRALRNPTRTAAATSFCHSYTQAIVTATTSLPPQFATACGTGLTQSSRLSSACSCYVCATGTTCQSGTCAAVPNTCPSYTASCSDVMKGLLASNSIASPQLVDYRIQSAILGITSPSDFLAALGPNPCQAYTDPTENKYCLDLLANSQFVGQLTGITTGFLTALQTCASNFASGAPDYQIIVNEPNATCPGHNRVRHEKRSFGAVEEYDLTRSLLEGIEYERSIAVAPPLGQLKSPDFLFTRRQLSTCSQTGVCFEKCPDCRDEQTYCGSGATVIARAVCGALAAVANAGAATLAGAACTAACAPAGPAALACAGFCGRLAGGLSAVVVGGGCEALRSSICSGLTQRCANCNSANNGICAPGSTQCCAGETGTQCGANCCCCPACQAPGGINCACTAAPC